MAPLAQKDHARGYIARFRLLRLLGRGAQGVVYLAHDAELDRQVAIKTLTLDTETNSDAAEQLLAAAKMASSLSHPNIVPVFEVGLHAGHPFVVFEYVQGTTLAELLERDGALPMGRAVILMSQVLAGLAHVHATGLLHGDIKPANILIGANGIPRVTDFGISRPARSAQTEPMSAGTVPYMAPECVSEGRCDLRADVFSLGLVFHEMLTGQPVFGGGNEYDVIYRILHETPSAPSVRNPRIDKRLDDIVSKALQRDPAQRYPDAGHMKQDLDRYRVPAAAGEVAELREAALHSTVEFLLRRMALKSDFPALSASFNRLNQLVAQGDEGALQPIADLVMRDFALTQKLLRVVNSAAYGNRQITKVSQAITILGMAQLRSTATALMLANGAKARAQSARFSAALTDAFIVGVIARNVGRLVGLATVEELFICGMFSRLGQLLTLFYLPEEHEAIERRMREAGDELSAARAVLGLSYEQLGAEVAKHWNFPALIVEAMRALPQGQLGAAASQAERMWYCAGFARELCGLARQHPATSDASLDAHVDRFAAAIPVAVEQVHALVGHSIEAALKYAAAAGAGGARTPLIAGLERMRAAQAVPADQIACARKTAIDTAQTQTPRPTHPAIQPSSTVSRPSAPWTARLARVWRSWL